MTKRVMIFKRFERIWHWSQAVLILTLLFSGCEVRGVWHVLGFAEAVNLHRTAAWALITLWLFAIFWHITTGEWRQYIPTTDKVAAMIKYYLLGIFMQAPHPFRPTLLRKHNPLQRLAYLFLWLVISPMLWISGWLYLFYADWDAWSLSHYLKLEDVAFFHVLGAFMLLVFLIAHLYLITTGKTPTSHLRAMLSGWEEIETDPEE